jgi:hypothetical protein
VWFACLCAQVFYKVHVTGIIIFTLFSVMHNKGLANWILPGLILYGVDRAFRYWQLATNWTSITFADFSVNGNILTLRLTMDKVCLALAYRHVHLPTHATYEPASEHMQAKFKLANMRVYLYVLQTPCRVPASPPRAPCPGRPSTCAAPPSLSFSHTRSLWLTWQPSSPPTVCT